MAGLFIFLLCLLVFLVIYFLPVIVAKCRGVRHFGSIVVINVFLGMTFIGWVIAFAMACSDNFKNDEV